MEFAKAGSISHGTLRPEDLIPAFVTELDRLKEQTSLHVIPGDELETTRLVGRIDDILGEIEQRMEADDLGVKDYYGTEEADWDLETLFDLLNEFAPKGYYFGSHEGDGSDFGFWPTEEA